MNKNHKVSNRACDWGNSVTDAYSNAVEKASVNDNK